MNQVSASLPASGRGVDALLAVTSMVTNLGGLIVVASYHDAPLSLSWTGVALLLAGPLALLWIRSRPALVLITCVVAAWAYVFSGSPGSPIWLPLIIALINGVVNGARSLAYGVVIGTLLVRLIAVPLPGVGGPALSETAMLAGWLAVLLTVGEIVRYRRALAAEQQRRLVMSMDAKLDDVRREVVQQRLELARDLHDVLGHRLAAIHVQAKLGLWVVTREAAEVRQVLEVVQAESGQALRDVQAFLDTLHDGGAVRTTPVPTVRDLDSLVSSARAAGLPVELQVLGIPREVPAPQDLSAGMVIIESITNVLRHAAFARTHVTVQYASSTLVITVTNPLPSSRGAPGGHRDGRGRGITGMRARISDHGGTLSAGPSADGQWTVHARIPIPEDGQ